MPEGIETMARILTITSEQDTALASLIVDVVDATSDWERSIPDPDNFEERESLAGTRHGIALVRQLLIVGRGEPCAFCDAALATTTSGMIACTECPGDPLMPSPLYPIPVAR